MDDLLKTETAQAIKSVAGNGSGDYRILAIDGKAVLAEKLSSPVPAEPASSTQNNTLLIGAIAIFGLGVAAGACAQNFQNAATIRQLTAENLILESKISKIRDLVR